MNALLEKADAVVAEAVDMQAIARETVAEYFQERHPDKPAVPTVPAVRKKASRKEKK